MIYETDAQFREELERRMKRKIPLTLWDSFSSMTFRHQIASHEPFDDKDLEDVVPRLKEYLRLQEKYGD